MSDTHPSNRGRRVTNISPKPAAIAALSEEEGLSTLSTKGAHEPEDASSETPPPAKKGLGAFTGVFRPTLLTIIGIMLYLREGWMVGNAGILGSLGVILLVFLINGTTSLSVSTMTTNIRLGSGGAFSLVSQSLGLEAGGAIGIPLFLALAMSVALYIYGFAAGWAYIFPEHPSWLVVLCVFAVCAFASTLDARLAFRLHFPILIILILAVGSIWGGVAVADAHYAPQWIGSFEDAGFWQIFAIFFPAGAGIMVGVSMSGQLEEPRTAIPRGIMSAWGVSLLVYLVTMVVLAMVATPEELRSNPLAAVDKSAYPPLVYIGLLASCGSAALGSFIAAPQVLHALGQHRLLPKSDFFMATTKSGVARNASLVTVLVVGATLTLGELDRVARMITMFFLITYATLNLVLLVEQSLSQISFRPTFKVSIWVPLIGSFSCVFAMMITSPTFGMVALLIVVGIYLYLTSQNIDTPWETVRSGIFIGLADWAAKKAQRMNLRFERAWKPDVLVPITSVAELDGKYRFLRGVAFPKGSIQILAIRNTEDATNGGRLDENRLHEVVAELQREDLFVTCSVIDAQSVNDGMRQGAAVMQGGFFRPNILFVDASMHKEEEIQELLDLARRHQMGAAVLMPHPTAGLGHERRINVWIRDQSPNWETGLRLANIHLTLLLAYQMSRNWNGALRMLSVVDDPKNVELADANLRMLHEDARLEGFELSWVRAGSFDDVVQDAPRADLQLFGLGYTIDLEYMRSMTEKTGASCLFVLDSGYESAFV